MLTDSIGLYVVEHVFKVIWCNTRSCRRLKKTALRVMVCLLSWWLFWPCQHHKCFNIMTVIILYMYSCTHKCVNNHFSGFPGLASSLRKVYNCAFSKETFLDSWNDIFTGQQPFLMPTGHCPAAGSTKAMSASQSPLFTKWIISQFKHYMTLWCTKVSNLLTTAWTIFDIVWMQSYIVTSIQ